MKQKLMTTSACILFFITGLLAVSCVREYVINDTSIDTAVTMTVGDITTSSAIVSLTPTKKASSFIVSGPYPSTDYPTYLDDDSSKNLAWIKENGENVGCLGSSGRVWCESGLEAGTEYILGCVATKADGTVCSAPWFTFFTTEEPEVTPYVEMVSNIGEYVFQYSISMNEFAAKYKYIVSLDKNVALLSDDELELYVETYGTLKFGELKDLEISTTLKTECTVAAIPYDNLDRPGAVCKSTASAVKTAKVKVGDTITELTAESEDVDIFTGTVELPASGEFTILLNGTEYGFISYSGNGGVGTVNNKFAAMPYYNFDETMTYQFQVDKAMGQMRKISEGGNNFWVNRADACELYVKVDMTQDDGIFRYYFEVPQDDENIVFYEGFDLSVWGGFYQAPVKGSAPEDGDATTWDGTEPGKKSAVSTTGMGIDNFCWPETVPLTAKEFYISPVLIKNWGLQDWTFKKGYLSAGHIRIAASSTNCCSYVYTPKLSALNGPTDVTLTFDCWNFAAAITDVHFDVEGGGTFKSAHVTNTAGYDQTFAAGDEPFSSDTQFVPTVTMIPKHANADKNKTITTFVFSIQGATSDTRLRFGTDDESLENIKDARMCIDYVKVTK